MVSVKAEASGNVGHGGQDEPIPDGIGVNPGRPMCIAVVRAMSPAGASGHAARDAPANP